MGETGEIDWEVDEATTTSATPPQNGVPPRALRRRILRKLAPATAGLGKQTQSHCGTPMLAVYGISGERCDGAPQVST